MPLNFDLGGKVYEPTTVTIAAGDIEAYAAASGDPHPPHPIGPHQGAPPHVTGEEEIIHHRPTRPGDVLVLTPSLVSVEDKGKGATFVAKVAAVTPSGE